MKTACTQSNVFHHITVIDFMPNFFPKKKLLRRKEGGKKEGLRDMLTLYEKEFNTKIGG